MKSKYIDITLAMIILIDIAVYFLGNPQVSIFVGAGSLIVIGVLGAYLFIQYNDRKSEDIGKGQEDTTKKYSQKKKKISQENIDKGRNYEEQIALLYRSEGYVKIDERFKEGKKDGGVDIYAQKDGLHYFIQCKNYSATTSRKIDHLMVSSFVGKSVALLRKRKTMTNKENLCRYVYVISNRGSLDASAYQYIKNNDVELRVVPYMDPKKEER